MNFLHIQMKPWLVSSWIFFVFILCGCAMQPIHHVTTSAPPTPCISADCSSSIPSPTPQVSGLTSLPTTIPEATGSAGTPSTALAGPTGCAGEACPKGTTTPSTGNGNIPTFSHVILILLENKEYGQVVSDASGMANFNAWAKEYTLLTRYYAVTHPSLPNYLALIGGETFGIKSDCTDCFVDARNLPELITTSHRTWKAYEENLPSPCFVGSQGQYAQKHNPFIYFDPIRTNSGLCDRSIVPLTQLNQDLANGQLPNFVFITPNLCNDAHDCGLEIADRWLPGVVDKIMKSSSFDANSLIVITFDEGNSNTSCCGLPTKAGGKVATLLISPLVKKGYQDQTPYSHYSLLKTISVSWGLPLLGHAGDPSTSLIQAPWESTP